MRRSWSPGAGAPSLPATFAIAAGIVAAVSFAVTPPPALAAALLFAGAYTALQVGRNAFAAF